MNLFKNPVLRVMGILALSLVLVYSCAKTPKKPDTNNRPQTLITSYNISTAPDSATLYNVTVYYHASESNGQGEYYRYWVDETEEAATADGTLKETFDTHATVRMNFTSAETTHVFYVKARDNAGNWDPSPASIVINYVISRNPNGFDPNTFPTTVPPDGAQTSTGVRFVITGSDIDGNVPFYQWAIDDTANWTTVPATTILSNSSILELNATIPLGPHTVYIRAVDNFGNVDKSPVTVSINAIAGFAPELALSMRDGGKFVMPSVASESLLATLTPVIIFTPTTDFYYGAIDHYNVTLSTGLDTVTTSDRFFVPSAAGSYWIRVTAVDIAGAATTDSIGYQVVILTPHQGILGVNGLDWASYGSEAANEWANAVPFGNFTHWKWWDLFVVPPASGYPFPDSLLGSGALPTWMLDTTYFSAVAWMANEFSGDEVFWNNDSTFIMNYLNNGGNLILATRYGGDFIFGSLGDFAGITGDLAGVNPQRLNAVADSLTDITRRGSQSFTSLLSVDSPTTMKLYEDPANPTYYAGLLAQPAGKGKFVFIAGRNYRWTYADLKANLDVIYRYYFNMRSQY